MKTLAMNLCREDDRVEMPPSYELWRIHPTFARRAWLTNFDWNNRIRQDMFRITLKPLGFTIDSVLTDAERPRIEEFQKLLEAHPERYAERTHDPTYYDSPYRPGMKTARVPRDKPIDNDNDSLEALLNDMGTLIEEQATQ